MALTCGDRSPPAAGGEARSKVAGSAWQLTQRTVSPTRKFHCFDGEVPVRLAAIAAVPFEPGPSTGWVEPLAGLASMPLSSAQVDGAAASCASSLVNPEWHLRQSSYSRATGWVVAAEVQLV